MRFIDSDDSVPWYRLRRKGCINRMCGGDDCMSCHPENFDEYGDYVSQEKLDAEKERLEAEEETECK
jgi:hypothetical protein